MQREPLIVFDKFSFGLLFLILQMIYKCLTVVTTIINLSLFYYEFIYYVLIKVHSITCMLACFVFNQLISYHTLIWNFFVDADVDVPKFLGWNPKTQCDSDRKQGIWDMLQSAGGTSALIREIPDSLIPFNMWGYDEKSGRPRKSPPQPHRHTDLGGMASTYGTV